jgi:hypothetical protein
VGFKAMALVVRQAKILHTVLKNENADGGFS